MVLVDDQTTRYTWNRHLFSHQNDQKGRLCRRPEETRRDPKTPEETRINPKRPDDRRVEGAGEVGAARVLPAPGQRPQLHPRQPRTQARRGQNAVHRAAPRGDVFVFRWVEKARGREKAIWQRSVGSCFFGFRSSTGSRGLTDSRETLRLLGGLASVLLSKLPVQSLQLAAFTCAPKPLRVHGYTSLYGYEL